MLHISGIQRLTEYFDATYVRIQPEYFDATYVSGIQRLTEYFDATYVSGIQRLTEYFDATYVSGIQRRVNAVGEIRRPLHVLYQHYGTYTRKP